MLNDVYPNSDSIDETDDDGWTPVKGLIRGAIWTLAAAIIVGVASVAVAWYAPHLALQFVLRTAMAFGVAIILFSVMHRASGMAGIACSTIVIILAVLTMLSHHVVFALHGIPTTRGSMLFGWVWLNPSVIMAVNPSTLIGITGATALCHGGGAVARSIAGMLMQRLG